MTRANELALFGGAKSVTAEIPEYLELDEGEERSVLRSLRNTPLTALYGEHDVERFERAFRERFRFQHSVAMSSGTASLHAAVAALGIGPGDEVITPSHSFVASVSVVVQERATPVFCDIEADTLGLDVAACEKLITPRTRAVIAVHVYGMPMNIRALQELCARKKIALIEDCAGAPGSTVAGRSVGAFGDLGCFSFNVHKVIRIGEGGMVVARNEELRDILRELRVNGMNPNFGVNNIHRLGYNYTLAQPLAALGCAQLDRVDAQIEARAKNRASLRRGSSGLPLRFLDDPAETRSVAYWTPMLLPRELASKRNAILRAARAEGIRLFAGYGEPLYRIEYLRPFAEGRHFPASEDLSSRLLVFDPAPYLTESAIEQITAGMRKIFAQLDRLDQVDQVDRREGTG